MVSSIILLVGIAGFAYAAPITNNKRDDGPGTIVTPIDGGISWFGPIDTGITVTPAFPGNPHWPYHGSGSGGITTTTTTTDSGGSVDSTTTFESAGKEKRDAEAQGLILSPTDGGSGTVGLELTDSTIVITPAPPFDGHDYENSGVTIDTGGSMGSTITVATSG
ncbi:hypothetical protein K402DRAFT_417988 [Aulographum hederae CBS 113979]|uniref:Uncharacterized protein n=1 Tax=Aulographum hederae CBS 113979 TaxID=1176131 RepID=A0A6G1HA19_9PEZI|nr:hypothetical protein K402DRAFT_417988 [Aulographum hederae CBS 113979]